MFLNVVADEVALVDAALVVADDVADDVVALVSDAFRIVVVVVIVHIK